MTDATTSETRRRGTSVSLPIVLATTAVTAAVTAIVTLLVTEPAKIGLANLMRPRQELSIAGAAFKGEVKWVYLPLVNLALSHGRAHFYFLSVFNTGEVPQEDITVKLHAEGEIAMAWNYGIESLLTEDRSKAYDLSESVGASGARFVVPRLHPGKAHWFGIVIDPEDPDWRLRVDVSSRASVGRWVVFRDDATTQIQAELAHRFAPFGSIVSELDPIPWTRKN